MVLAFMLGMPLALAEEDTTSPRIYISSGPSTMTNSTTATFEIYSNEAGTLHCYDPVDPTKTSADLCGTVEANERVTVTYSGFSEGQHSFWVYAMDAAGNGSGTTAHYWAVDTIGPTVTLDSGPATTTTSRDAVFTFSSPEQSTDFQCKLDGGFFEPCLSPKGYSSLAAGTHTFYMRGTDLVNNLSATESYTWTVEGTTTTNPTDTVRPSGTVVINGGRLSTSTRAVNLTLSATDPAPGSGVAQMRIKNGGGSYTAWQPYATSKSWSLTAGAGTKTVYVQYRDGAGNISAAASDTIRFRP